MADLVELFGEDIENILEQLDKLSPEQELLLLAILEKASLQADLIDIQIRQQVKTMMTNGMTRIGAESTIRMDLRKGGPLYGLINNYIKSSIIEGVNQSSRLGQYQNYDLDEGTFSWVTVSGHRICDDCQSRATMGERTFNEWADIGLPGSGWSVCKQYCYCVLDPTGDISKNIEVPTESKIREKGA